MQPDECRLAARLTFDVHNRHARVAEQRRGRADACRLDARHRLYALQQLLIKLRLHVAPVQRHGGYACGRKPETDGLQPQEAFNHQPGAGEQHE